MKIKLLPSLLLITCSFSLEKDENINIDSLLSLAEIPQTEEQPLGPEAFKLEVNFSYPQNPQRFFNFDKTSSIPLNRQYTQQAIELYEARKLYLQDQTTFLKILRQKALTQGNIDLQSLHPWFQDKEDVRILRVFEII